MKKNVIKFFCFLILFLFIGCKSTKLQNISLITKNEFSCVYQGIEHKVIVDFSGSCGKFTFNNYVPRIRKQCK